MVRRYTMYYDAFINGILEEFEDVDIYSDGCYLLDTTAEKVADEYISRCNDGNEDILQTIGILRDYLKENRSLEIKNVLYQILRKTFPIIDEKIDEATNW
jgi:hypothetical protein